LAFRFAKSATALAEPISVPVSMNGIQFYKAYVYVKDIYDGLFLISREKISRNEFGKFPNR
jgi:hypothetical protein